MNFKPVIFLAFANDKVDNAAYLRNLSAEMHGIRKALGEAVNSGLCEVVERSSSSIGDILDVFTDPIYGPRVSIFHYGGHADGFSLLLEAADGSKQLTNKEGLIPFFARQENLKLIFLNGCSSEGQASDLLKAGIPAVIGTTTSINDEVATALAIRFYSSLADGAGIEKAWTDATDEVKITKGTANTRALYWEGKKETTDHFPWVIQFKPGAEVIKEWNLPDISGNPLYGLPSIPTSYNLPESPFLYLNRYERKHAEVFFGRSYFVRSLFSAVTDNQGPPIILLCGQSGTGKSSLLEAGLQPRLEAKYEIMYLRRNGAIGLSSTVFNALLEKCGFTPEVSALTSQVKSFNELDHLKQFVSTLSENYKSEIQPIIEKLSATVPNAETPAPPAEQAPKTISEAWKLAELKFKKPLLIILDQLEEAYTRPNELLGNEMNQLFLDLKNVLGNPVSMPQGKILLSYRKEYQPEIEEHCKKFELSRSKIFIEHIIKNDIVELFNGFVQSPRIQSRYHLQVEEGLPEIIANDLEEDKDTPIAPMLQVLMTKMWMKAYELNPVAPLFSKSIYRELKEEGLAMDEFLQNQLLKIKKLFIEKKTQDHYTSGFVLDVLFFHCTPNSTSAARTEKQLLDNYPFAHEAVREVLGICKEHYLITDLGGSEHTAMLAHDTLAKSVVKAQQRSTQPIQQGKRILFSRMEAIRGGSDTAIMDSWELKLIEKIQNFLPAFNEGEKKLFNDSRKEILRQEKQKRRIVNYFRGIVAISVIGSIVAWIFFSVATTQKNNAYVNMMAASSTVNLSKDPTMAMQQALYGMHKKGDDSNVEIKNAFTNAFYNPMDHQMPWYEILLKTNLRYTDLICQDRGKWLIPFARTTVLSILDDSGNVKGKMESIPAIKKDNKITSFSSLKWSHDGNSIVALTSEGAIQFHDASGKLKKCVGGQGGVYSAYDISPTSNELAISWESREDSLKAIKIFDMEGNLLDSLPVTYELSSIHYKKDGKYLLIDKYSGDLKEPFLVEGIGLKGKPEISFKSGRENLFYLTSSFSGNHVVLYTLINLKEETVRFLIFDREGTIRKKTFLCNVYYDGLDRDMRDGKFVILTAFHPSDSLLAFRNNSNEVQIHALFKKAEPIILKHDWTVTFIAFSKDGKFILTGSADNIARIWDLKGGLVYSLMGHQNDVTGGKFIENDRKVITISMDGTIRSWELDHVQDIRLASGKAPLSLFDIDSTGKYGVSVGDDRTIRIWDLKSRNEYKKRALNTSGSVTSVQFIDGDHVLGSYDGITYDERLHKLRSNDSVLFLYTVSSGDLITFKNEEVSYILNASSMGNKIISSTHNSITYWNRSGHEIKKIHPSIFSIKSIKVSQKDSILAVGTQEGPILLYNYRGDSIAALPGHEKPVTCLDISQDGRFLISVSDTSIIWDLKSKKPIGHPISMHLLTANFSNSGNMIVTTSKSPDRIIRMWNSDGELIAEMVGHRNDLINAFFSQDEKMIYSYSKNGTVRIWDLEGKEISAFSDHGASINNIRMNPDLSELYCSYSDGSIRIWLTPNGIYQMMQESKQFLLSEPKKNKVYGKFNQLLEWLGLK